MKDFVGKHLMLNLRPEQKKATDAMLEHEIGVLSASTAFGKTVVAANMIARRGVNTLVLVHNRTHDMKKEVIIYGYELIVIKTFPTTVAHTWE